MSGYRLTPRARAQLADVYDYTTRHWGRGQADKYVRAIQDTCEALGDSSVRLKPVPGRERYVTVRSGSHLLLIRRDQAHFTILAILHQSMDLPSRIRDISKDG